MSTRNMSVLYWPQFSPSRSQCGVHNVVERVLYDCPCRSASETGDRVSEMAATWTRSSFSRECALCTRPRWVDSSRSLESRTGVRGHPAIEIEIVIHLFVEDSANVWLRKLCRGFQPVAVSTLSSYDFSIVTPDVLGSVCKDTHIGSVGRCLRISMVARCETTFKLVPGHARHGRPMYGDGRCYRPVVVDREPDH